MSDSNRVQVSYQEEVAWSTPQAGVAFLELPVLSGNLRQGLETVRSAQRRSDQQVAGTRRTGINPTGSYDFELQGDNYDTLIRAALRNLVAATWTTEIAVSVSDCAAASPGNTYTSVGTTINTGLLTGQWIYVGGYTNAANNGWKKVKTLASKVITVEQPLATEAAPTTVTMKGQMIRNGSSDPSFCFQENYADETALWKLMDGCMLTNLSLSVAPGAIMRGTVSFEGDTLTTPATGSGSAVTAMTENGVIAEVDGFDGFWVNNLAISAYDLTGIDFQISQKARRQRVLGELGAVGLRLGPMEVSGTLETYLSDEEFATLMGYQLGYTAFGLAFAVKDSLVAPHRYLYEFPACYFTGEAGDTPGSDSDIMQKFDWSAEPGTLGTMTKTIQICKVSP